MSIHLPLRSVMAVLVLGAFVCTSAIADAATATHAGHTQLGGDAYFTDSTSGDFVSFFAANGTWDIDTGQALSGPTVAVYVQHPDGVSFYTDNARNVTFHVRPRLKTLDATATVTVFRCPVSGQCRPFGEATVIVHLDGHGRPTHAALHRVEVGPTGVTRVTDQFTSQPATGNLSFGTFGNWNTPAGSTTEIIRDKITIGSLTH